MSQPQPPIDLEHLRLYTLGDAALERELMQLFLKSAHVYIEAMQTAADDAAWRAAAHGLKGSARSVGANRAALLAERGEKLASGPPRRALLAELAAALAEVADFAAREWP